MRTAFLQRFRRQDLLHEKSSLPLRISSVNVTKSDMATFTEEILNGKLQVLCYGNQQSKSWCLLERKNICRMFEITLFF